VGWAVMVYVKAGLSDLMVNSRDSIWISFSAKVGQGSETFRYMTPSWP
jgi:hypothetical protein